MHRHMHMYKMDKTHTCTYRYVYMCEKQVHTDICMFNLK